MNSDLFFLGAVFYGLELGLNTIYVCILGEERNAFSLWPSFFECLIILCCRRAGRQVESADDRDNAALHAVLDGRGNVEDIALAAS